MEGLLTTSFDNANNGSSKGKEKLRKRGGTSSETSTTRSKRIKASEKDGRADDQKKIRTNKQSKYPEAEDKLKNSKESNPMNKDVSEKAIEQKVKRYKQNMRSFKTSDISESDESEESNTSSDDVLLSPKKVKELKMENESLKNNLECLRLKNVELLQKLGRINEDHNEELKRKNQEYDVLFENYINTFKKSPTPARISASPAEQTDTIPMTSIPSSQTKELTLSSSSSLSKTVLTPKMDENKLNGPTSSARNFTPKY